VRCVYLLRSKSDPSRRYVGCTENLRSRLADHNSGKSPHTAKYKPWRLVTAIYFADAAKADAFERYLKQGTGHAFANRHFW
jgi:putative endonuclease